jgi:hypothetical protein
MSSSTNILITAMEALLTSAQQAARDTFLQQPGALEHRMAVQAFLVRQCQVELQEAWQRGSVRERERIVTLAWELRHALDVYRRVLRSGVRCNGARLETALRSNEERSVAGA